MDAYLAVVSKRDVRAYADRAVPEEVVHRILEAGRVSGSAMNRQPWRFLVVEGRREEIAATVFAPDNIRRAPLVIAVATAGKGPTAFDAGRAAQSMMLAAWSEGVGSCPNGVSDADRLRGLLPLDNEESVSIVLSFGYPARTIDPESRSADEWIERADRRAYDEVVRRV